MVSRKRSKGKERKAKKEEKISEEWVNIWQRWTRGEDKNGVKLIECDHGCAITTMLNEPKHPVSNFINELFTTRDNWMNELNSHSQVWENEDNREMTINILLSIGTNLLLSKYLSYSRAQFLHFASTILVLENYKETKSMNEAFLTRGVSSKIRDLGGGNMRDMLKFFSKRTTCSCLKNMYSEARKNMPKMGKCSYCNGAKERRLLSVCSKCRVAQYCSRECQVAHWPEHEKCCDACVRIHGLQCKN